MLFPLQSIRDRTVINPIQSGGLKRVDRTQQHGRATARQDVVSISKERITQALQNDLRTHLKLFFEDYPEFRVAYPRSVSVRMQENSAFDLSIGPFQKLVTQPEQQQAAAKALHGAVESFITNHLSSVRYLADESNNIQLTL